MTTDPHLAQECREFLFREAELLDAGRLEDWLDLLTEDVTYRVPRRVAREKNPDRPEFSASAFHFREDKGTLRKRVERFGKEYAWSENPPSRTRHHVSNVRVDEREDGAYDVTNNLLLVRSQGDTTDVDTLSGERRDVLERVDGDLRLSRRVVRLDHTVLDTRNLSVFL